MDAEAEYLVEVKEESIDDDDPAAEGLGDKLTTSSLSLLSKEDFVSDEIDQKSGTPFLEVFVKTEPAFQSGTKDPICTGAASDLCSETFKAHAILPITAENQSIDDCLKQNERFGPTKAEGTLYSCEMCSYKSSHLGNFRRHVKLHNPKTLKAPRTPKERLYTCELCGYKCVEFTRLKRHLMTHTGEKPLACETCSFRTSHSNELQRHMMIHTGEKPHACDLCDYKSSDVRNLKRHMRTHTGEKPYACDLCRYRSRNSHHMSRHKRMKH